MAYKFGILCRSAEDVAEVFSQYGCWSDEITGLSIWSYKERNYPGHDTIVIYVRASEAVAWDTLEACKRSHAELELREPPIQETFNNAESLEVILNAAH